MASNMIRMTMVLALALSVAGAAASDAPTLRDAIRTQVERTAGETRIRVGGDWVFAVKTLPGFYELRGFEPAWLSNRRPAARARQLVEELRAADAEGMRPADYHLARLEALLAGPPEPDPARETARLAALDLLLTDAFLIYGAHLVNGRVRPETFEPDWFAARKEVDLPALLATAVNGGDVRAALRDLRPHHPGYARLVAARGRHEALVAMGGWPAVPGGPTLKPGESGERIRVVRNRLRITGELDGPEAAEPELFDEALAEAVRRFQRRHGLDDDGAIGKQTLEAMNVTAGERLRQIELNLERWRWLPLDLGERYILVNVPDFRLEVVERGEVALEMRVIVGRVVRKTPVFSDTMRYLVLSPSWEVPPTILRKDKLPELRKDPGYAARQNMTVFQISEGQWRPVDPLEVDWATATGANTRLRQAPGPNNALGLIKFMFPNPFNVYLHDTPSRELFARSQRDFSSGCIRIEKPLDLAKYLLHGTQWEESSLRSAMQSAREQTVQLPVSLPVHILYWTAWADADGSVQFRRDLYGRDPRLDRALGLPPPTGNPAAAGTP